MNVLRHALPLAIALAAASHAPAQAAELPLDGLSWSATGAAGLIGATDTVPLSPTGNALFGYVTTFGGAGHFGSADNVSPLQLRGDGKGNEGNNNGSVVTSSVFDAVAASTLSLSFNYVSTDGRGYEDYAWARLVNADTAGTAAWLYTARSTNTARGNVVPGDVLKRQLDKDAPVELDAVLNNGASIGFDVASTAWAPLGDPAVGGSSGFCWTDANTCGPSGWIESRYTVATSGRYYLEFGVVNWGDEAYDSALAFDFAGLAPAGFAALPITPAVPEPSGFAMLMAGVGVLVTAGLRRRRASQD